MFVAAKVDSHAKVTHHCRGVAVHDLTEARCELARATRCSNSQPTDHNPSDILHAFASRAADGISRTHSHAVKSRGTMLTGTARTTRT